MTTLNHKFVECIPDALENGVLYVSITHSTAVHLCCCGCGREVVTPLTRTDWKLIFDGETVSLYPSIGNWRFPCRSHYWITHNRVEWAENWSEFEVAEAEEKDRRLKAKFYSSLDTDDSVKGNQDNGREQHGFWQNIWNSWR